VTPDTKKNDPDPKRYEQREKEASGGKPTSATGLTRGSLFYEVQRDGKERGLLEPRIKEGKSRGAASKQNGSKQARRRVLPARGNCKLGDKQWSKKKPCDAGKPELPYGDALERPQPTT